MAPAIGAKAPPFTLPRDGGGRLSLSDFKGRKLVLYFYPKADTPGCTKEAIAFSGLKGAVPILPGAPVGELAGVTAVPEPSAAAIRLCASAFESW